MNISKIKKQSIDVNQITGIKLNRNLLPEGENLMTSRHPEAVRYRRAMARASNAIESVVLTDNDKHFMNSISPYVSTEEFNKLAMEHLNAMD